MRSLRSFAAIIFLFFSAFIATAQTNPPPATYVRSYVNDLPDQPLVTVTVTGAVNVACFTIEETLPGPALALSVSSGGTWLPSLGAIRWGPFTNTVATNVSYRLTGMPASYPVNGGAWMDGQWYFSPAATMVTVLPPNGGGVPQPPLQLPSPIFMPPSGADVPINVLIGMPGVPMTILDDTWNDSDRTGHNPPFQSAWFVSGSGTNLTAATNALTLWPHSDFSSQIGILNLAANLYGDYGSGVNAYSLSLSPGTWQFLLVSPDLYSGATYYAWKENPGVTQWHTEYNIYGVGASSVGSGMYSAGTTPQLAFSATKTAGADKATIMLTNSATLHLGVGDQILSDNLGGVSVRVTRNDPLVGITYFAQTTNTPIDLGVGDGLRTTLKIKFAGTVSALTPTEPGLRVGLFNFTGSTLSNRWVFADGFAAGSQGSGVKGYSLFQYLGARPAGQSFMDIKLRTNVLASDLLGKVGDHSSMSGPVTSNNFPTFVTGRDYILTLNLQRLNASSMAFSASWLDTVTGGVLVKSSTNNVETNFRFDGLAMRAESSESTASNIILGELKVDYLPAAVNGLTNLSGVTIHFTLDGTTPTLASSLYTGAIPVAAAAVIRATAFANGWTPSASSVAYYGPPAAPPNVQVSPPIVDTNTPTAPIVTIIVVPGTNASCVAVTESLALGLGATNVSSGGSYIASNNVVLWGPYFGTNAQTLSYQAVGSPGTYPVKASWSVDGVGGSEATGRNIVIAAPPGNLIPTPPPQVAAPTFTPGSGSNVPVNVTISCTTPGARIYYTLNGSLPTASSQLYTGAVSLASASTVRAVGFTNGWVPSVASVAYYGPPAAPANAQVSRSVNTNSPTTPVVTFSVVPGANASCIAVTESLPLGIGATSVTAGGNYIASNNVVVWGPFFGTNAQTLSYQAVGQPGTYATRATWSVDGVSGGETVGTNIVVASPPGGGFPTAPPQEPMPTLSPSIASNLPVTVSISSSDAQAQIYFTTDGSLPTQNSTPYTTALNFSTRTTLRARAFRANYLPSVSAVGEYSLVLTTNTVSVAHSVSGNGSFLPTVTLTSTPQGAINCYSVTETIPFGLTPSGVSGGGYWDPFASVIRWGPYLDNQARLFSYNVGGPSGTYPLSGQVSFNGYSLGTTGASAITINANNSGPSPNPTNLAACSTDHLTYNVNINPAPGVVTVTSVSGTVSWGDGTQSAITQPVMTLQKPYSSAGNFNVAISADWSGYTANLPYVSGHATLSDSVLVVTNCAPPQIVTQPTNQVALAGSTVQFTVSASSPVPMIYQWYFNTNAGYFSPSAFATLTLPNITPQTAGHYSVVITNTFGSVTSSVATLTVVVPLVTNVVRSTNGRITLSFVGLPNTTTRLWATTNLASSASWQPIFTNTTTTTNGTWQYTDTNAVGYPARFYRFSTP